MKRALLALAVAGSLAAIPGSHLLWGKGHVPLHKEQACHKGETITVSTNALPSHQAHGDCQLPKCDFANIFHTGDPCTSSPAGGQCAVPNTRTDACGVTPGCPAGPACF